jgi:predicted GIY-YIG superfamily endonuclease
MSSYVLYRFYDATDRLLYIGLTENPHARFKNHRFTKQWWEDVVSIQLEKFQSRDAVVAAERKAIERELPVHNVHNNRGQRINVNELCECDECDFADECSECDVCSGRLTFANASDEREYVLVDYGVSS